MLRSLVGSEMCIRDRYQRRVREIGEAMSAPEHDGEPALDAQISRYLRAKDALREKIKTHGSAYFTPKTSMHTGLYNQAATCYMNSLLQSLYFTSEFRSMVFQFRWNQELHPPKHKCIPYQLQHLFARMQLSSRAAVSTKDLTRSFGWEGGQVFVQHDVQELNRVLFEALEMSQMSEFDSVKQLYTGRIMDVIQDVRYPRAGTRSVQTQEFLDLQLDVTPHLSQSFLQYTCTETIEGWDCVVDGERQTVVAEKGFKLSLIHI
eukprot:TRINITY_DN61458_c0_g1_i1.p1 TRINITY_DN61458_c0_g1~~TRINITY_DN61458_c0_g1_i1.p1  ORF type:complete len:262 (+),score=65.83 TRINITY_DN61458_c0_g1_i1:150-935(+)